MSLSHHFKNAQIRTNWDASKANRELANRYGRRRFDAFCDIADDFRAGTATIRDLYGTVSTLSEAGLLMSQQGRITFDLAEAIVRAATPALSDARRVADLGCWTAPLAAHVAAEYPDAEVVGVDREGDVLRWAAKAHDLPNLSFAEWDYTGSPPVDLASFDVLLSVLGIDFDPHAPSAIPTSGDAEDARATSGYRARLDEARPIFSAWAEASVPDANLIAGLRLSNAFDLLAALDAAHAAGWAWQSDRSTLAASSGEVFPVIVWAKTEGQEPNPEQVVSWRERCAPVGV